MKTFRTILLILALGLIVLSCKKDDPFYQVNNFETALLEYINEYRISESKSSLVWFPDLFVEAREQSIEYKKTGDPYTGLYTRLGIIQDHWEPVNKAWGYSSFIGQADTTWARAVVNGWIADSASNAVLLDDFVQYGAGMTQGEDVAYVIQFLIKIP